MPAYYNEIDPYAARWLRNLIAAGHIAPGDVDERSIVDVRPDDLKGYEQCHFFAGIGGWSHAARLAGWPDDRPLWTGSCPCQPFSAAGLRKGEADERHLWPVLAALIRERRPAVVAGEQVASKDGLGWLDGVCADLEAADYSVWAADYCAASVGAPHIRQRLWWVADTAAFRPQKHDSNEVGRVFVEQGASGGMADAERGRREGWAISSSRSATEFAAKNGASFGLADSISERGRGGTAGGWDAGDARKPGQNGWGSHHVGCADGRKRRIEPSIQPLAHGVSNRVGRLRAYGNAIVPQVAAEILRAYLQPRRET